MQWYRAARDYYRANGDLAVRKDFITEDGRTLGVWLTNHRAARKKNEGTDHAMPMERVKLLDEIGMRW